MLHGVISITPALIIIPEWRCLKGLLQQEENDRYGFIFHQVLQKLGKADETKDLAFEEGVINFNKQLVSLILFVFNLEGVC